MDTKARYQQARHEARTNRRNGQWLCNPVRLVDGYHGLFVRADGQVCHFAGFNREEMFPIGRGPTR